ncbi:MAG: FGGY-family carbohydrate kinase [Novosphingobium sp.]|nr:FGGY-family carbohydrate kinase [Novosphingobium sp.]MBX9644590.1 FGGY-family carbohydrate kinase [Novosphingobium sp.]
MAGDLILAIDNGTQSVRTLAFDLSGKLVAKSQVKLDGYTSPGPGWMEHDVDLFWTQVCRACQDLWATGLVDPARLAGMVVTTQRATVITLDAQGQPLRPAIVWPDQRRAKPETQVPAKWRFLFKALGLTGAIRGLESECEARWIAQNEPSNWKRTEKLLLLSGYLNYRFTGRFADAVGSQVGYIPFDYKKLGWAAPGDWRWPLLGIAPDMLPELVLAGELIGQVSLLASQESGIPAGLPVIAGASDKACEVLGSGCLTPDVASISCGTMASVNITTPRYFEAITRAPAYPAALPGQFNSEVPVTRGYWMVSWFAEQFGHDERQRAAKEGKSPEALFDELVHSTPPGAHGLMLQPYWNSGVGEPGPEARGAMIGFTDSHTRAHFYRAIIEGLGYGLREGKERIEAKSKVPISLLRVAGGGSQSDAVMQVLADVFNLPAERPEQFEASGLGAAIIGTVGLGLYPDFPAAVAGMTRVGRRFEPSCEHAGLYDRLYKEVYSKLYKQLQPLYHTLREIG